MHKLLYESQRGIFDKQLQKLFKAIETNIDILSLNDTVSFDNLFENLIIYEYNLITQKEYDCYLGRIIDVLNIDKYNRAIIKINEFAKDEDLIPDKIIFAMGKSFRNIPIDKPIKINNKDLILELWIEWIEENISFNREDLIIINNTELKLAGFNFTNTDDMLNYVFKHTKGGQITIYRQIDFFLSTDGIVTAMNRFNE